MSGKKNPMPGTDDWHAQNSEDIIDPKRRIIDPHHHLWKTESQHYLLEDLWADTEGGHRIEKTVYIECNSNYRTMGPERMRPVGETETVAQIAAESAAQPGKPTIAAIVSHANLLLGEEVSEILLAHEVASQGLFRGIRHVGAYDTTGSVVAALGVHPCPYGEESFRQGVKSIGAQGYTFDAWHFYHQSNDFVALARAVPNTTMILDHFGSPLGVGIYADRQNEIFEHWRRDVAEIACCDNVMAKLGGLAMPFNGFGWHTRSLPPSSDEFVTAQGRYYHHMIECFGPDRCMFESNFPVDRLSISYRNLWNGLKKIAADFSEDEKHALFYGTAARVYRLQD